MKFTKMQGIGNDFVMVDTIQDGDLPADLPGFSRSVTDRRLGVGGDGLILIERGDAAPFRMRMFNPDGSEAEMCGNGIRCFGRLLKEHGHITTDHADIETGGGILDLQLIDEVRIRVDVGLARLTRGDVGMTGDPDQMFIDQPVGGAFFGTAVLMGNPHLVIFVPDVAQVDLPRVGPIFEHHPFFPNRVNVHFVEVVDKTHLIQRTWERGAGITLACGTGACSCGVAAFLTGRAERSVEIQLPGGKLEIEYLESGHVLMTGAAETVFEGEIDVQAV